MLSDLTSGIFNAVHARLSGSIRGPRGFVGMQLAESSSTAFGGRLNLLSEGSRSIAGNSDQSSGVWVQAFGGYRDEDATRTSASATHSYAGGIAGADGWLSRYMQIGAFAGGANGDLDVPLSQDIDVDSLFGGAYANLTTGSTFLRVLLTAGTSDHDSTRRVANNLTEGGIQLAKASYDGHFVSPELAAGMMWDLGWLAIEPSARLRYAHLSLDGYNETGAAGNFSVGDRDLSVWLGRAQLAFPFISDVGTLSPRIGIEAWSSDNERISGVLLGQALSFKPGGEQDDFTGFVGVTGTTTLGREGLHAFVDFEIHAEDDGFARSQAQGGIR